MDAGGKNLYEQFYAESIVETVREPLLILDDHLVIKLANPSFYNTFQVTSEETLGTHIHELGNGQWDIPELKQMLGSIVSNDSSLNDFEVTHDFPCIGRRTMLLNGRRIVHKSESLPLILLAIEDITDRIEARNQNIPDSLSSHIAVLNENGTIVAVNESWRKFARDNGLDMKDYGIGTNYFTVCASNNSLYDEDCSRVNDGIKKIISGETDKFEFEYPCHSPTEKRWFLLRVTKSSHGEPLRIILSHENITGRKLAELERSRLMNELGKRVKELTTLHEVAELLQEENRILPHVLKQIVNKIPKGWLYPEITAARINYKDNEYRTDNYKPTQWKMLTEFTDSFYNKGSIEVVLLEERDNRFEDPFLKEERELLNSLAYMIKRFIDNKISRNTLKENLDHISKLHRYEEIVREIIQSVHSSLDLQDVLNNAVKMLRDNIENVDNVSIYTIQGDTVILKAYSGYPKWYIDRISRIPYPVGTTWRTINENKSIYIEDTDYDEHIGKAGIKVGTKSYFSTPIHSYDENRSVVGCLHLHSLQKHAFGDDEINLLETVTRQIEVAFNNARKAEELRESKERYQTLFEQSPVGVFIFDRDLNITDCNNQLTKIIYSSRDDIIGLNLKKLKDQKFSPYLEKSLEGVSGHYEGLYTTTTSNIKLWLSIQFSPLTDSNNSVIGGMVVLQDISERVEAEQKIKEQAELLDKARDAIEVRDLNNKIIYWNSSAEKLYGWSTREVIGKDAAELLYTDDTKSQLEDAFSTVLQKGEWNGELNHITKDGSEIIVDSSWTQVRDESGNPKSMLIVKTDITDKKNFETQLLRAQRMESIGTLAGGIAHDLNNVLQPIMLTTELLKSSGMNEKNKHLFNTLETSANRASNLVNQVLSFSRGLEGEKIQIQLRHIIKEIEGVIKETFPRAIQVETDISKDLLTVIGDTTKLHQVIMNLCINARDAMPDGGKLRISAENFHADENYARMNPDAKTGNYVVITVSDNGTGIPKENINKIFEPFFTTKEINKGTGLGLSTAFGIVKSHEGFMKVYSEPGKGSEFRVYIPSTGFEEKPADNITEEDYSRGNGELIMVVDDEESVRNITCMTLESHGYRVISASDGAEAIPVFNEHKDEVKIVIMDMMMPVLSGSSSMNILRKINPELKIIASTGLEEQLSRLDGNKSLKPDAILPKPYTSEKLLRAVSRLLEN